MLDVIKNSTNNKNASDIAASIVNDTDVNKLTQWHLLHPVLPAPMLPYISLNSNYSSSMKSMREVKTRTMTLDGW